jgi:hypothetical protein
MSTPHAIEIDGATLAALRDYAPQMRLGALCAGNGPLSDKDRQALEAALQWWEQQYFLAKTRIQEITARLACQ